MGVPSGTASAGNIQQAVAVDPSKDIEVGAAGEELRYWKAKEAVRQGEARLAAQAAIRTALEARATAITGWAAAGLLAVAGAGFAAQDVPPRLAAATAAVFLLVAATTCIHVARPRDWAMVGYDPVIILEDELQTELEVIESMAKGISPGIQANNNRINQMGRTIRRAGWCLIFSPVLGVLVYLATKALTLC